MKNVLSSASVVLFLFIISLHADAADQSFKTDSMVFVKGSCFQMGDVFRDVPSSEKPVHEVCVDDFYIGKYEITVGEFRQFAYDTGYKTEAESQDGCHVWTGEGTLEKTEDHNWRNPGFSQKEDEPVVCVSWNDTREYLKWLNEKTGMHYRLPTEAEWEYAARSRGKNYRYSWGDGAPAGNIADESAAKELSSLQIWKGYDDGYAYTAPVGSFRPNDAGIHEMSGNAYEWVYDWQQDEYYSTGPKHNPMGPDEGKYKLLRGGAWDLEPDRARTTSRYWNVPGGRAACIGFRVAHPK